MSEARLEVTDVLGRRIVTIEKEPFLIGRQAGSDLHLPSAEVSRDHAEIVSEADGFVIRDRGSRYGTFINDKSIERQQTLAHGDRIRLGRTGGAEIVFLSPGDDRPTERGVGAIGDLKQVAALLEGLRALSSARVLDDVLTLVMDSAIEVGGAERGFIMLANEDDELEFTTARSRDGTTLPGSGFETSRKIPEEVFRTGKARVEADLLDGDLANQHMGTIALGIRNVLCVPLRLVRYADQDTAPSQDRRVGVLYLDSREKGTLCRSRPPAFSRRWPTRPRSQLRTPSSTARLSRRPSSSKRCRRQLTSSRRCCRPRTGPGCSLMSRPRCCRVGRLAETSSTT